MNRKSLDVTKQPIPRSIKIPPDLDDRIHAAKGSEILNSWIKRACEELLRKEEVPFA